MGTSSQAAPEHGVTVRPASADDIAAMTAIYAEAVRDGVASYELVAPDEAELLRRFRLVTDKGYPWLVAVSSGLVVGYAYANAFRERPAYRFLVEDSVYLASDWRGRGIGRHLLAQLIERCETAGFRQMLAVIGGAEPASIALHRAAGFEPCGRIACSGYKFGRWLDTVLMQRQLGEGATTLPSP